MTKNTEIHHGSDTEIDSGSDTEIHGSITEIYA